MAIRAVLVRIRFLMRGQGNGKIFLLYGKF